MSHHDGAGELVDYESPLSIYLLHLPSSLGSVFKPTPAACPVVDPERRMECLTWGDDYQLLFTLPDGVEPPVAATRIGKVEPRGFAPLFVDGEPVTNREGLGYVHK